MVWMEAGFIRKLTPVALAAMLVVLPGGARAAELRVLTAGAFRSVLADLAPEIERDLGTTLVLRNETAGAVVEAIRSGAEADLVVVPPAAATALGPLLGPVRPLARVGVGVAVKDGASRPAIGTEAEVQAAILAARAPAWIDPVSGGSSGIYMTGLVMRWGIADTVMPRAVLVRGGLVADALRNGRADLAFQQISELHGPGVTIVGPLPASIQSYTIYAGGVPSRSTQAEAAGAVIAWLASPRAAKALAGHGMEAP